VGRAGPVEEVGRAEGEGEAAAAKTQRGAEDAVAGRGLLAKVGAHPILSPHPDHVRRREETPVVVAEAEAHPSRVDPGRVPK
jgi:hypothetical protein